MTDPFDLARFVLAQDAVMAQVRDELAAGHKRSHWMWFVFPQLRGLGRSPTAQHYGLASRDEAAAYAVHSTLGPRLVECTRLVLEAEGRTVHQIFGSPDDLKFHSCMTLFASLPNAAPVFDAALAKYFGGARDRLTLGLLSGGDR